MTTSKETIATIVDDHPEAVRDYYRDDVSDSGAINFLVGQVLVAVGGDADPADLYPKIESELEQQEPTKLLAREMFMAGYEAGVDVENLDDVTHKTGVSLFERYWEVNHE